MNKIQFGVAALSGAAGGLGRALALALADRGSALSLADQDAVGLATVAESCRSRGVTVTTHALDVSDRAAVAAWAEATIAAHGAVDLLINNAGVAHGATIAGTDYPAFERVMAVNFWGVVYATKAFLPHLETRRSAQIVNISSIFGLVAEPALAAYSASKFAVRAFSDTLHQELALTHPQIGVTTVFPGGLRTAIARAAPTHPSLAALGLNPADAGRSFERFLRGSPERAAARIVAAASARRPRLVLGLDAQLLDFIARISPSALHHVTPLLLKRWLKQRA